MAEMQFTPAQAAAIESRGSAVLVSAAAGSGKTRVLTERLMAWLTGENSVDIDRFLIITFTKAAAGELRSRILEGISERSAAQPENRELRRQMALVNRAQIGTIHSFCGNLLREHCAALALPPDFRIADENQAISLKAATLERLLEDSYQSIETDEAFRALVDSVGAGRDDRRLQALTLKLYEKMQAHARPSLWAERQAELLRLNGVTDTAETPWGQELLRDARAALRYWQKTMDAVLTEIAPRDWLMNAYGVSFSETADGIYRALTAAEVGWDAAAEAIGNIEFPKLGAVRNPPEPEVKDRAQNVRKRCKAAVEKLQKQFAERSDTMLSDLKTAAPAMIRLLELAVEFDRRYTNEKRRRGLVDYADLEHLAAQLLTHEDGSPTELAASVSGRFREVMVDEYQDVSEVQDQIFRAVSDGGKQLFLVGDVKQSIYRFRLADPTIFLEKYNTFSPVETAADGQARRILLQENFRSRGAVLEGVNHVFKNIMSTSLGELDYDENARLKCGLDDMRGGEKPELCLLQLPDKSEHAVFQRQQLEAEYVASRIRQLMDEGYSCGDMVILLRSANSIGPVYRQALIQKGIPVDAEQGGGFYDALEISVLLSLLSVIDNPHQDVPLVAVLASPLFGFSSDELAAIREQEREKDFCTALKTAAESDEHCRAVWELITGCRERAPDLRLSELIWYLYDALDLLALCSAMADGEMRTERLMQLLQLAKTFEATGYRGLHRFVQWLSDQAEQGREPAVSSTKQAVRIMSIHRSKGLEFPIVFLCDLARQFNQSDARDDVLIHPTLGLGPKCFDPERGVQYPTFARSAVAARLTRETLSEEMRLLYVAMTRAKEKLILTGTFADVDGAMEACGSERESPIAPELLREASSPILWLLRTALLPGGEDAFQLVRERVSPQQEAETELLPLEQLTFDASETEADRELAERLTFVYPHGKAAALPSKVTATELKKHKSPAEAEDGMPLVSAPRADFRKPDFQTGERPLTAAEKGTATHRVLQYLTFSDTDTDEAVSAQIRRLTAEGFLSDREARAVQVRSIRALMASELGARMKRAELAGTLKREQRFSILVPASELFADGPEEKVLLQGVVDCSFEEDGKLIIVDYKTDRIPAEVVPERTAYYASQLRAYGSAVERITGLPVSERLLFFLHNGIISEVRK